MNNKKTSYDPTVQGDLKVQLVTKKGHESKI